MKVQGGGAAALLGAMCLRAAGGAARSASTSSVERGASAEITCLLMQVAIQEEPWHDHESYRCVTDDAGVEDASYTIDSADLDASFGLKRIESGKTSVTINGAVLSDGSLDLLPGATILEAPPKRQPKAVRKIGTSSTLVLRISGTDARLDEDAATISRRWFGGFDDEVNMKSRFADCS